MPEEILIPADGIKLPGILEIPEGASGLVIFAHGTGSSRLSPRNQYVADVLNKAGIATLLFDLLTPEEDQTYEHRFNIDLLTERLYAATLRTVGNFKTKHLPLGYFGASTGAAAALINAAELTSRVHAVVSRGGRPDLAMESLPNVEAPTLLIVGGHDYEVIKLNQRAYDRLHRARERELAIVDEATHLFEEPGTLEQVSELAKDWFLKFLRSEW